MRAPSFTASAFEDSVDEFIIVKKPDGSYATDGSLVGYVGRQVRNYKAAPETTVPSASFFGAYAGKKMYTFPLYTNHKQSSSGAAITSSVPPLPDDLVTSYVEAMNTKCSTDSSLTFNTDTIGKSVCDSYDCKCSTNADVTYPNPAPPAAKTCPSDVWSVTVACNEESRIGEYSRLTVTEEYERKHASMVNQPASADNDDAAIVSFVWNGVAANPPGWASETFTFAKFKSRISGDHPSAANPLVLEVAVDPDASPSASSDLKYAWYNLGNGWNWVSWNLAYPQWGINNIIDVHKMLLSGGETVKSQNLFTLFYNAPPHFVQFFGDLTGLNGDEMFAMNINGPQCVRLGPYPPTPLPKTVTLRKGWNFLVYPYHTTQCLGTCDAGSPGPPFDHTVLKDGDVFKSQEWFTQYYDYGAEVYQGWLPAGKELTPTKGYKLLLKPDERSGMTSASFTWPSGYNRRHLEEDGEKLASKPTHLAPLIQANWTLDAKAFADSASVVCAVAFGNGLFADEGTLVAFKDGEIRGVERSARVPDIPVFGAMAGKRVWMISIHGDASTDAGSTITFKFQPATGGVFGMDTTFEWRADAVVGNAAKPYYLKSAIQMKPMAGVAQTSAQKAHVA